MISSHKRNIVNVMRSVSRLSRRVSGGDVNSLPFPFSEVPLLHKVRTASAFCLYGIGKNCWSSLEIQAALFTQPKQSVNQRRLSQKKLRRPASIAASKGVCAPQSSACRGLKEFMQCASSRKQRRDKIWIAREMTGASPTFAQNFV
jgi:hypothetical protein